MEERRVSMNRILGDRTGRMRERLLSARLGNLDRQNERLRNEVSVLHSQLDHEREEHEELCDALRSKPKEVKVRKPGFVRVLVIGGGAYLLDRKSTRLNSSHLGISYAVFCLKKKNIPSC